VRKVVAREPACGEALAEEKQRAATPAAEIEDVDSSLEPIREARDERKDVVEERREHGLARVLRHPNRPKRSYGMPPPSRKQRTMSSSTVPPSGRYWANTARCSAPPLA
jgi:hypothetical protein